MPANRCLIVTQIMDNKAPAYMLKYARAKNAYILNRRLFEMLEIASKKQRFKVVQSDPETKF